MLYRIGTVKEILALPEHFPEAVLEKLYACTALLDDAYGADRDYLRSGGYSLLAETKDDVEELRQEVDYENRPCEWVDGVGEFLAALFLKNDDYSIVAMMPIAIAPREILNELEE